MTALHSIDLQGMLQFGQHVFPGEDYCNLLIAKGLLLTNNFTLPNDDTDENYVIFNFYRKKEHAMKTF